MCDSVCIHVKYRLTCFGDVGGVCVYVDVTLAG